MTRKSAIVTLLFGAFTGTRAQTTNSSKAIGWSSTARWKRTMALNVYLEDESYETVNASRKLGGIDAIEVQYNGQSRRVTAREIWEALK